MSASINAVWDVPVWSEPVVVGKHLLHIVRNTRSGLQRYYIDGREVDVNSYLAITAKHAVASEARLRLRDVTERTA